jgi:hypothetical protein
MLQADNHGRREVGPVIRVRRLLESHGGNDVPAVLIEPLCRPQQRGSVVIADDPQLAVKFIQLHELDALPDAWEHVTAPSYLKLG